MKKLLGLLLVVWSLLGTAQAQNTPCSGKKGGISHCEGATFVCNDGSTSRSKKACSSGFSGENETRAQTPPVDVKPATETSEKVSITQQGNLLELDYQGCWRRLKIDHPYRFKFD